MDCLWYVAGSVVGLALGLQFGRLLFAILAYWESTETAGRWYKSIICFVLGGGAGTVIFRWFCIQYADAFYAIGLGLGLIIAYIRPRMPCIFTVDSVIRIVKMSEALQNKLPSIEQRLYLILSFFAPIKCISRGLKITQDKLAQKLEQATDAFENTLTEADDNLSPEEGNDAP